jgi:hypothetical protein
MQFYEYKDYLIYPIPHLAVGYWSIEIVIKYNDVIKTYVNNNIFITKGEAVFHSIQFGKKLIDQGIVSLGEAIHKVDGRKERFIERERRWERC